MELWLIWSLLLACCLCHSGTSGERGPIAKERHRILVVKKGRTAYLNPRVVLENPPSDGTCLIQVIKNDPMTQRVGKLTPEVFKCDFQPFTVKYEHSGSPLLQKDEVLLMVHHFKNGRPTRSQKVSLTIDITDARHEILVDDPRLRGLEVQDFFGLSNPIEPSVVRFRYNYYDGAKCIVTFTSSSATKWPQYGQLIDENNSPVSSLRHDCRDFLYLGLKYKHDSPPGPDRDYLPLTVEVNDPAQSAEPLKENVFLPIVIHGAAKNTPPKVSIISNYAMEAEVHILTTVNSEAIKAEDAETSIDDIVFQISTELGPDDGFFVHMDDHTNPITSFKQGDLIKHHIAYSPPNTTSERQLRVEFVVYDSHFVSSEPATLDIEISPSRTTFPRVAANKGLLLVEGSSMPITNDNFAVVDSDSLENVRMYVKGGLRHGRLEVNGAPAVMFSPRDIESGTVIYHHDGTDTSEDKIILRISDEVNQIRAKFPIVILPIDDSPPYLTNNIPLQVDEGGYVQVTPDKLSAHDKDSDDDSIIYSIRISPGAGELVKKYRPSSKGTSISRFTQKELLRGLIYYHHFGTETSTDSFEFRLMDNHDPPNRSGKYGVAIAVVPANDLPPKAAESSSEQILIRETDIAYLTQSHLKYLDEESTPDQLVYTITNQPFFLTTTITIDAGRVVYTEDSSLVSKNPHIPAVHTFTQQDINDRKIAYMPPAEDIGPIRRHARFMFTIADSRGHKVVEQPFDITILPVNNQLPHMSVRKLSVVEGGTVRVSTNEISAYDPDTDQDELRFVLEEPPQYGQLLKEEIIMSTGDTFTLQDLVRPNIRYIHDGSEKTEDRFLLMVSDGFNQVRRTVSIDVRLVNDHVPKPLRNLRKDMMVREGGEVVITSANLAATDNDTDDQLLTFILIRSPQYGEIRVRDHSVKEFAQADIWNRAVRYIHTSGEIGIDHVFDSATFAVTDGSFPGMADTPLVDLNITIQPGDNMKPSIILGSPLFVDEGRRATISKEVVSAQDVDTIMRDLKIFVTKPPTWGFIENTNPASGSIRGRPVSSFSVMDIKDRNINYVQANHTGVEPLSDSFEVYVTDGQQNSQPETIKINIVPRNDEIPKLNISDMVVGEGSEYVLSVHELVASDADLPRDKLVVSVAKHPRHGDLSLVVISSSEQVMIEVPMREVTVDELQDGMHLKYKHDGSQESGDEFTLMITDGVHKPEHVCHVKVMPLKDEHPQVTKNAGLKVNFGGTALVSSMVLKTLDSQDSRVYFVLLEIPKQGVLQLKRHPAATESIYQSGLQEWQDLSLGMNFTQDDVDMNHVRYVHTGSYVKSSTDLFVFQVNDGEHRMPKETFDIEIISSKSKEIALLSKGLAVKEGDSKVLSTGTLRATDGGNQPDDLVFTITGPPKLGYLGSVTEKNTPVSTFTQADLNAQKIVYIHTSKADFTEDVFSFTVKNSLNHTKHGTYRIRIEPMDKTLPTLDANVALTVVQSHEAVITIHNLHVSDPDTPIRNITYYLTELPKYGYLLRSGAQIKDTFTQHDIDDGQLVYKSDGSDDNGVDFFMFMVHDINNEGYLINGTKQTRPAFFNILIQPLDKEPPALHANEKPRDLKFMGPGKYGFILTDKHLRATHPLMDSTGIVYTVLDKPSFGYMENTKTGKTIRKRFRQSDVDEGKVAYILSENTQATNDSFIFRIQDSHRNTLDNLKFELEWARIQFEHPSYIVCEDAELLPISVIRTGATNITSSIDIKSKGMSAKEGVDYVPSENKILTFAAGISGVTWAADIIKDTMEEGNEKFRVLLKASNNAVLGENDKATVTIVNLNKNGRCDEYIGMITKDIPNPIEPETSIPQPQTDPRAIFESLDTILDLDVENEIRKDRVSDDLLDQADNADASLIWEDREADNGGGGGGRKNKRRRGRKRGRGKGRKGKAGDGSSNGDEELSTLVPASSTLLFSEQVTKFAPQPCTRDTMGLLYFDLYSSRMFRCSGVVWEPWNYSQMQNQMLKTEGVSEGPLSDSRDADENRRKDKKEPTECGEGWSLYREHCFKMVNDKDTWNNAEQQCEENYGGHLAHVDSAKHLEWLWALSDEHPVWIGLNDKRGHHHWEYTNGQGVRFYHWRTGFPRSQWSLNKHCVLVSRQAEWVNRPCDKNEARYVCVQPLRPPSHSRKRRRRRP